MIWIIELVKNWNDLMPDIADALSDIMLMKQAPCNSMGRNIKFSNSNSNIWYYGWCTTKMGIYKSEDVSQKFKTFDREEY